MSREPEFALGDQVCLKSGGPSMTIEHINTKPQMGNPNGRFDGTYDCVWFEGTKLNRDTFIEESLKKYIQRTGNIGIA